MKKYPITLPNGEVINASHIGVNHTIDDNVIGTNASSYSRDFDNDDEVCIEIGVKGIRYAKIGDIKEAYKLLRNEIITKTLRNIDGYSECVYNVVSRYFGNFKEANKHNNYFPTDEEIAYNNKTIGKVSDLAYKNMALSFERAMLAQNLLMEIGIKSTFKASPVIINDKVQDYAFNIVSHDKKHYIFDTTIPTVNNDKVSPLICEIPNEVYEKLIKANSDIGYSVDVTHYSPLQNMDYHIVYDAGREDVYKVDKSYTKKV